MESILEFVARIGPYGPAALILIYILACVTAFPASILTLAAGFLFGVWNGYWTVVAGSLLGASAAFWIGRTVGREWIRRKAEKFSAFAAIDRAVATEGFKIVLLTRLSPVFPFNIQNFAYGVTGVSFRKYVWASWIGMIPGTILFVYLGSAMKSLSDVVSGKIQPGMGQKILLVGGIAATAAVTVVAARIARKALKEVVGRQEG